ncbi:tumor necrosis factor ligand superfamily member 10 [Pseudophryne corroboree]|uniref:tumor necrosis factor ligand superfamily member 10 n=1 Tax=Pseudophryne corroboree TaxID=495146 RepID=UPI0030813B93
MFPAAGSHSLPLCGLVLLAVLLQSVLFAVTYVYFTNEIKQLHENYIRNNIACLVDEDLRDVSQTADIGDVDEKEDPCWAVKTHLQILIRKILMSNYGRDITSVIREKVAQLPPLAAAGKQAYSGQLIAAHVTGSNGKAKSSLQRPLNAKYNGHKITEWTENAPSFFSNIRIHSGEMLIQKSGLYYIYAQTYFRHQDTEEAKVKQLVQYVYKVTTRYTDPLVLMKNVKTTCWSQSAEYGLHSIYQGGVFQLYEDDRIFVTVSDISIIDMDEKATFWGAFLVN